MDVHGPSKFFRGRPVNIVSGFKVVLDLSGVKPPQIGPGPARVKQFSEIKPPHYQRHKKFSGYGDIPRQVLPRLGHDYQQIEESTQQQHKVLLDRLTSKRI